MVGTVCLQILLRVALSSVVKSRNGFEYYKKIDSDEIKAETRWENVKTAWKRHKHFKGCLYQPG